MAANPSIQLGTDGNWAIKEDNLLAYKKDGTRFFNKEFDFTRGSLATFVDKDGLIKVSGVTDTELVVNGDFATDSDWTKGTGWSISGGAAVSVAGTSSKLEQQISGLNGKTCKVSLTLSNYGGSGSMYIDFGNVNSSLINTNGEHILYGTFSQNELELFKGGAFSGSIDNVSVKEIQTDVPRIDFTDDATGHLLLEPQSTNLITYSEDFRLNSNFRTNAPNSIFESGYLAPDGSLTATRINGFDGYYVTLSNVGSGDARSMYVKSGNGQTGNVNLLDNAFDAHSLFEVTNEWKRVELVGNDTWFYIVDGRGASLTLDDVIVWGLQQEDLSYTTSYIPTFGSAATRNAEVCNNSGSAQDFNDSEGVLYAEIAALADDGTNRRLSISDGSNKNRIVLMYETVSNTIGVFVISNWSLSTIQTYLITDTTQFSKIAFKYKQNDFSLWIDGVERTTSISGTTPTGLKELAFDEGGGGLPFYGKVKNVKVFKRAMSDGELYLLTVPQYQSYQEMATALNYTL
jgi:hypothetical protein